MYKHALHVLSKNVRVFTYFYFSKDNTIPNNYRPIALTSCLCKTFERIVNDRLVWFLEQNHIISKFQAGFRHGRSTNDQLLRLETSIREAFIKQQHLVAIFFDLEKAYDTAWKYGILKDLHDSGLRGYLPTFISNFLQNRNSGLNLGIPSRRNSHKRWELHKGASYLQPCLISK